MADENKLVGSQYLKLDRLQQDVKNANELLKSIGSGVDLNQSNTISSQLKQQLNDIVKATQEAANTTKQLTSQIVSGATGVASSIGKQAKTEAQYISQLTSLYKQYYSVKVKLQSAKPGSNKEGVLNTQAINLEKQIEAIENLNAKYSQHEKVLKAVADGKRNLEVATASKRDKQEAQNLKQTYEAVKKTSEAYKQLKTAYSNYDKAVKRGDSESASHWQSQIVEQQSVLTTLENQLYTLNLNEDQRKQINNVIRQAKDLENEHNTEIKKSSNAVEQMTEKMLRWVGTMVVMRGLSSLWSNATEYAQTYYDKLNEIRIVTGMSESASLHLGDEYRQMAKDMKVSSTDIVSAATEFWRQGLPEGDVESRQVATTQYAKISGLAFEEAAELVTAATNSMGLDVQNVVDVFNYLGDASASGADEIGIAMQKASASAQAAGVSFEWLGAYIAAISEQTRQAPEVIGTSINSIMARLHSIKQNGFNEDDETKINDVAKALSKVGIALMDQDGNWRDMSTIFIELASIWGTLDDKTKSYIATTMAGTRQQNYFLALMKDMSKGIEGGSRAFALYEGAMNSAGTTAEKYAIWMESVEAAQNGLTAELEEFYSLLSADWMKGFYNGMAGFVSWINLGTDGLQGANLIIPLVTASIIGLSVAIAASAAEAGVATWSFAGLWTVLQAHPVALAVTAFVALAGLLTGISAASSTATENIEQAMGDMKADLTEQNNIQTQFANNGREIESLKQRYIELAGKTNLTVAEQEELKVLLSDIAALSPSLADAIRSTTGAYGAQTEVVKGLNDEQEENYRLGQLSSQKTARDGFASSAESLVAFNTENQKLAEREKAIADFIQYRTKNYDQLGKMYGKYDENGIFMPVDTREMFYSYIDDYMSHDIPLAKTQAELYLAQDTIKNRTKEFNDLWGIDSNASYGFYHGGYKRYDNQYDLAYNAHQDFDYDRAQNDANHKIIISGIESQQNAFRDTQGLYGAILDTANAQADAVLEGIDYSVTDANQMVHNLDIAAQEIQGIYAEAHKKQEEFNNDDDAREQQEDIETAKRVLEADKTEDNLNAYNSLVRKWNESFSQYGTLEELSQDAIKKADSATVATEESVGAAAEYARTSSNRLAQQEAAEKGYIDQLNEAKQALGENGQGYQAYRDYMDNLAKTNYGLFTAFMDEYEDLAKIYNGEVNYVGTEAVTVLDAAIAKSNEVAEKNKEYYAALEGNTSSAIPTNAPQDVVTSLISALTSGYAQGGEAYGLDSMLMQLDTMGQEARDSLLAVAPWLAEIENGTMSYSQVLSQLNEQMIGTMENWSLFMNDLADDSAAGTEEAIELLDRLANMDGSTESIEAFRTSWNGLSEDAQSAVKDLIGENMSAYLDEIIEGGEGAEEAFEEFRKEAKKLRRENTAKYFKETVKAAYELEDGTKSVEEAYEAYRKEAKLAADANEEYAAASEKMSQGAEVAAEDIASLAEHLGVAPETLIKNWDVAGRLQAASLQEGEAALHALNEAAFIHITGTSSADFSALQNGLILVTQQAQAVIDALRATGQWELETIDLPQEAKYWIPNANGTGGSWGTKTATAGATVLRYKGTGIGGGSKTSTPKSSSGGGGGGGGGGGSSKVDNTADEQNLVDNMTWQIESVDRRMAQLNAIMSKYETEGYLTGIINCLKMENDLLGEQNTLYQNNLITLDGKLKSLRSQLSGLTPGTAEYDDVLAQIAILQDAYSEYTLALLENEAAQAENAEAMKEQEKAIRQLEIDLRDELLQAIEDREAREEEALEARIEMEETIMDIIRKRYEEERDQILKNTELQIESLEREKDALDEALEARREAEEEQDRAAELAELEAQYARIIADPTRAKEAQEIRNKINDLRDEIAWDTAEKEVEAQQESLDQQITSLEDYAEYIENYYDELLENPQNFIAEVNSILNQSQEDILTWLKENSEEYATATEATQKQITDGWTETLNSLHGVIETHWAEIENIIAQGDEAILKFLMDNRQDYAEAGKLQAEAYVDAWKEQLEDLDRAYKDLVPKVTDDKKTNTTATSTGSGGSTGGGGNPGGTKTKGTPEATPAKKWKFFWNGGWLDGYESREEALNYIETAKLPTKLPVTVKETIRNEALKSLVAYKRGGIADFTGPAWLDGTKTNPERILTPYQTKLFEDMIATLHRIDKVRIPSLPAITDVGNGNGGNSFNFGDIILNVDKLSDDEDFEEVAEKICAYVVDRMNRGSSIGGIRQTK